MSRIAELTGFSGKVQPVWGGHRSRSTMGGNRSLQFLLTSTPLPDADDPHWLPRLMERRFAASAHHHHTLVDRPEAADAIIFFEMMQKQPAGDLLSSKLRTHPWVREFPEKCYVADNSEMPAGWLPGVYTSMPAPRFDPRCFRAMGFPVGTNPLVGQREHERTLVPHRLCSFRGANQPGVRAAILSHGGWPEDFEIRRTEFLGNWRPDVDREYRKAYVDSILGSRFVLCPRGYATSTFRMYETMQLGRVPVVLSDDWVAPSGPDWGSCSVRVAERDWASLPDILGGADSSWPQLAANARTVWEQWFSNRAHVWRILDWIAEIATGPHPADRASRERWRHKEFIIASLRGKA